MSAGHHVVIGAGAAGTYAAWQLAAQRDGSTVTLFESSDRIGGRLFTRRMPGMPHVVAEVGGMRFMPHDHVLVDSVATHLALPRVPFYMGDPNPAEPGGPPIGSSRNLYYVRGRHLTEAELRDPGKVPYRLGFKERGKTPTELQIDVMNLLVPNAGKLSLKEWFDVEVLGRPLYEFGFWNLLARVLSNEAYAFMTDAGGYAANTANANAVYQLPATEYGSGSVDFYALRDGFQSLPLAMAGQFRECGGEVRMNQRLAHIERSTDGRYRLTFETTATSDGRTTVVDGKPCSIVEADDVILAMPRRSLELIDWACWKEDRFLRHHLGSVLIQHAFKLLLGYEQPWWRSMGLRYGRSITDLPLRQVYYFDTEGEQPGADPNNLSSLLLASYSDIGTVPFWKGLERGEPFRGRRTRFTGDEPPVPPAEHMASELMVAAAVSQVEAMHGYRALPAPYTAIYHDWSADPFGGGWHEWKAGFRYAEVIPEMVRPVAGEKVYICGEAYSSDQGWVEGALDTTQLVLERHLGVKRPSWIRSDFTFDS